MKQSAEMPEIDLTLDDIVQGEKYTRKIVLKSENPNYNGKTVHYRVPSGQELAHAMRESGLSGNDDLASNMEFSLELVKVAVVPPELGAKFGQVRDPGVIKQLGDVIMGASRMVNQPDEAKVEKIFQKP